MSIDSGNNNTAKVRKMEHDFELTKLCRVCLVATENLSDMETEKSGDISVRQLLNYLLGQECFEDELPKLICKRCMYHSECTFIFKRKCERAFKKVSKFLHSKAIILEPLIEISEGYSARPETKAAPAECNGIADIAIKSEPLDKADDDESLCEEIEVEVEPGNVAYDLTVSEEDMDEQSHYDHSYTANEPGDNNHCYINDLSPLDKTPQENGDGWVQFLCETCGKNFMSAKYLDRHMERHLGEHYDLAENDSGGEDSDLQRKILYIDGKKYHTCTKCRQTFVFKANLDLHLTVHSNERPHMCSVCGQTFVWQSTLDRHKTTHRENIPFVCKACDKTFTQLYNFKEHLKFHKNGKHYMCSICNMTFGWRSNLVRHEAMHAGEKRHACRFCQRRFLQKSNMLKHEATHSHKGRRKRMYW